MNLWIGFACILVIRCSSLTNSMAYGTRKSIAAVTHVRYRILSCAVSSQFSSRTPTSRRTLLILSSQRRLGLPNSLFPSGLPTRIEYNLRFFPIRATWPAHLSRLYFIIFTTSGESYSPWSSLCSLLHSPVISSRFGPYILLKTLFSNTRNLCSSAKVVLLFC